MKKKSDYETTKKARLERRLKWKLNSNEARISSWANCFRHMRIRTQEETAKILCISRQRVQQLERLAIWKIRQRIKL